MKKILFIILALYQANGFCQIDFGKLGTDILIENSIKSALVVIKSDYQLKNAQDGILYGRGGKDVYSSYKTFGLCFPSGVVAYCDATRPWLYDKEFDKFRKDARYVPVLKNGRITVCTSEDSLEIENSTVAADADSSLFFYSIKKANQSFIIADNEESVNDYWVVWYSISKNSQLESPSDIHLNAVYQKNEDENLVGKVVKTPYSPDDIIGGIVMTPVVTGVGKVELHLTNVLMYKDKQWQIVKIPSSFVVKSKKVNVSPEKETPQESAGNGDTDSLTPINSGKTSKKKRKK